MSDPDRGRDGKNRCRASSIAPVGFPRPTAPPPLLVTTTTVTTYPTQPRHSFSSNPTEIDGSEVGGATAMYTPTRPKVIYVFNVGTQIPPAGTRVVARGRGDVGSFRYDS